MKKSDIMVVIFLAAAGVAIAYFVCNAILPEIEPVTFNTIEPITADVVSPDPEVFNSAAINPTVETYVGSCVDQDQNGELDLAESVVCHDGDINDIENQDGENQGDQDSQDAGGE